MCSLCARLVIKKLDVILNCRTVRGCWCVETGQDGERFVQFSFLQRKRERFHPKTTFNMVQSLKHTQFIMIKIYRSRRPEFLSILLSWARISWFSCVLSFLNKFSYSQRESSPSYRVQGWWQSNKFLSHQSRANKVLYEATSTSRFPSSFQVLLSFASLSLSLSFSTIPIRHLRLLVCWLISHGFEAYRISVIMIKATTMTTTLILQAI